MLRLLTLVTLFAIAAACTQAPAATVDKPVGDGADWERFGRTYSETHFSPLSEVNAGNVRRLGLAWFQDLPVGPSVGVSQPLAIDGVLYFAVGYSVIYAMDAASGRLLWQYVPDVFARAGYKLRAGWGVRGIAYSSGKVFTATLDGRLIAIDASNGGAAPDLRKSPVPLELNALTAVVRDGALRGRGMPAHEQLTMSQIEGLQHFIRMTARQDLQSGAH